MTEEEEKAAAEAKAAEEKTAVTPTATTPLVAKGAGPSLNLAPNAGALAPKTFPSALAAPEDPVAAAQADKQKGDAAAAAQEKARDAEIEAKKDEIRGKQEATAKSDAAQAADEKAALDAKQARDIEAKKFRPEPAKPIPYKPTKPTGLVDQWGSTAMLIAMLGSMFTRNHAVTALNAAAAAMNGFKQGDEAAAKQAMEEWKVANQNMLDTVNYQQKVYDNIMKDANDASQYDREINTAKGKTRAAELKAAALSFEDKTLLKHMETEKAENVFKEYERQKSTALKAKEDQLKIDEKLIDQSYSTEVMSKWTSQTPLSEKLAQTYAFQTKNAAEGKTTSKLAEKQIELIEKGQKLNREQLNDLENSDEMKAAKAAGDNVRILELRSKLDPKAATALDKHYENKAATSERFMKEPPKNSEERKVFDDEMLDYALYRSENKQPSPNSRNFESSNQRYNYINNYIRTYIDPKYDPSLFNRYRDAEKMWTTGKRSDMLLNQDTSAQHLAEYEGILKDIKDASVTKNEGWFNRATQTLRSATGNQDVKFESAKAIYEFVAAELIKSSAGTTALHDRMAAAAKLDPAQGLAALLPAVDELKSLQGHRLNSLYTQYKNSLPQGFKETKPFASNFGPETIIEFGNYMDATPEQVRAAKDELAKRKGETPTAGAAPGAASNAPAGVPEGASKIGTDKSGKFYFDPNNKAVVYDVETGKSFSFDRDGNRVYK
jgi:hypothetical protein